MLEITDREEIEIKIPLVCAVDVNQRYWPLTSAIIALKIVSAKVAISTSRENTSTTCSHKSHK